MEQQILEIELASSTDTFSLFGVGDLHCGNITFDEDRLKRTIRMIEQDPLARWIAMGDMGEFINQSDPRFLSKSLPKSFKDEVDDLVAFQVEKIYDILEPIIPKCVGWHGGNHEYAVMKHYHTNPVKAFLRLIKAKLGLDIPDFGYGVSRTRLVIKCGRTATIMINSAHGTGGGELPGASHNRIERAKGMFTDDVFFRGHTHELYASPGMVLGSTRRGELRTTGEPRMLLYSGNYFRTYPLGFASYGEQKILRPLPMGSAYIQIKTHIPFKGGHAAFSVEGRHTPIIFGTLDVAE